jgi:hypothetical protein
MIAIAEEMATPLMPIFWRNFCRIHSNLMARS